MELLKIDHSLLFVSNLQAAFTYYSKLFNASVRYRDERQSTLIVEIGPVRFFIEESTKPIEKSQHLSFQVNDLSEVRSILKLKGILYREGNVDFLSENNYHWIEWSDPDGIRLECVTYKE